MDEDVLSATFWEGLSEKERAAKLDEMVFMDIQIVYRMAGDLANYCAGEKKKTWVAIYRQMRQKLLDLLGSTPGS